MSQYKTASEYWRARKAREATKPARVPCTSRVNILDNYCFCRDTSLAADRCDRCGKRPYTD